MSIVRIEMLKGKTTEYKKTVMGGVPRALVDAFAIPEGDRLQRLYELDRKCFDHSDNRRENFVLIELTVFRGAVRRQRRSCAAASWSTFTLRPASAPTMCLSWSTSRRWRTGVLRAKSPPMKWALNLTSMCERYRCMMIH